MYFLTCAAVDFYALAIPVAAAKDGLQISALHGKMKQTQREATLAAFTGKPAGVRGQSECFLKPGCRQGVTEMQSYFPHRLWVTQAL